jgi:hypothetical protein
MTSTCYRFEEFVGENPLFLNIDATYVIHLEGNGRIDSVKKELTEFYPSKNTFILFNKGFKKCEKSQLPGKEPRYDLIDANLTIFRDAQNKKYKNILVLEDDYFFHKEVRNHTRYVDEFIDTNQDNDFIYFLGCLPLVTIPTFSHHNQSILSVTTHSVMYSESYRNELLRVNQKDIEDWDVFQFFYRPFHKYLYYTPLCYQLFPETDNSKLWGNQHPVLRFLSGILKSILNLMKLDVQAEPSYSILYFISKILVPVLIFIVIFLCCFKIGRRQRKVRK